MKLSKSLVNSIALAMYSQIISPASASDCIKLMLRDQAKTYPGAKSILGERLIFNTTPDGRRESRRGVAVDVCGAPQTAEASEMTPHSSSDIMNFNMILYKAGEGHAGNNNSAPSPKSSGISSMASQALSSDANKGPVSPPSTSKPSGAYSGPLNPGQNGQQVNGGPTPPSTYGGAKGPGASAPAPNVHKSDLGLHFDYASLGLAYKQSAIIVETYSKLTLGIV